MQGQDAVSDAGNHNGVPRVIDLSSTSQYSRTFDQQKRFRFDLDDAATQTAPATTKSTPGLGDIVERAPGSSSRPPSLPALPSVPQSNGFPVPKARRLRAGKLKEVRERREAAEETAANEPVGKDEVARDSEALLAQMSEAEILEEKAKLEASLPSDLLAFVRRRAQRDHPSTASALSGPLPSCALSQSSEALVVPTTDAPSSVQTEMLFTLTGSVISTITGSNEMGGHIHAGPSESYSLPNLLRLARSTLVAQRSTALQVLARILERQVLQAQSRDASALVCTHLDELSSLCVATLGSSERSMGVLSGAVSLLNAMSRISPGPLRPAQPATVSGLCAALYRHLEEKSLERGMLELMVQTLEVLSLEVDNSQAILANDDLLKLTVHDFICVPWPAAEDSKAPVPAVPRFLRNIASQSRDTARALLARRTELLEPLLRFVVVEPYSEMLVETLLLWTSFARYGLGSELRASAGLERHLIALETYIGRLASGEQSHLVEAWYNLIGAWSACATDPHRTDPPHSTVWSVAEEWGEALCRGVTNLMRERCDDPASNQALAAALDALAVWLDGAAINWTKHRLESFRQGCQHLHLQVQSVFADTMLSLASSNLDSAAHLALGCIRLLSSLNEGVGPIDPDSLYWLLGQCHLPRSACLLCASIAVRNVSLDVSTMQAVLDRQLEGDGHSAQAVAVRILARLGLDSPRIEVLRPFIVGACLASSNVAPLRPLFATLPLVQTLRPPRATVTVLPSQLWPLTSVLQELLRAGESEVIRSLAPGTRDEAAILDAALAASELLAEYDSSRPTPSQLTFELMKVFMLEKDVSPSPDGPLFRQPAIANRLQHFLHLFPLQPKSELGPFGLSTFPDFYEEFVVLYAAVSLGDPLFGRFLLLPLSFEGGETIVACARTLFHRHHAILRTISDLAVEGHPALETKMQWASDEVVQGALQAALSGNELRPDRNGKLMYVISRALKP